MTAAATSPSMRSGDLTRAQRDALAGLQVLVLGGLPDLAVALARRARGQRGVQLGPTLVSLGLAAVLPQVGRCAVRRRGRLDAAVLAVAVAAPLTVPALTATARPTVLGTGSPLWSLVVSGAVRATVAAGTVIPIVVHRRRRLRAEGRDAVSAG